MKLEHALAHVEAGWSVFPLKPNEKVPLSQLAPHGLKNATKDPLVVRRWWGLQPDANIAIVTGRESGVFAVDVDVKKGGKGRESIASLPELANSATLTAATPTGGWHLYFAMPDQEVRNKTNLLPGIDIRGEGGYVAAPGSVIDGRPYSWLDAEAKVEAAPQGLLELLRAPRKPPASKKQAKPAVGGLILEGSRNATLTSLAGKLRRQGLTESQLGAALREANAARCRPPLPDAEVETIARSVARYEPAAVVALTDYTEDRLALEFTRRYGDDLRFVAAWGQWLAWTGTRWRTEDTLQAYDLARAICREAGAQPHRQQSTESRIASAATVAAVERLARADRQHAAKPDSWDGLPWHLNTPGGVVDLKTGKLEPNRREHYMTKLTATEPSGSCPIWRRFLQDVTGGDAEIEGYLRRIAGYALTGDTNEHALFFLYGTGANGKSVFLNALSAILGDYATSAPIDTFLEARGDRHPTDLAALRGARLVSSIEVDQGRRWAEAKLKSLTGGDKIAARFMRQDFFQYRPQFKLFVAGNHKPAIRGVDEAMRRRLHLIPFTVTIPPERRDKALPEKLMAERAGILAWAVTGCLEWQRSGLQPPAAVLKATQDYFEDEDAISRWIEERCEKVANATATAEALFTSWKAWAEQGEEFVGSQKRLAGELESRGFKRTRDNQGRRAFRGLRVE